MPIAKVNGIELYYEVHGEGVPLVLISGLGGSSEYWTVSTPILLDKLSREYNVIVFDNRGTGRSGRPDVKYSIRMMADDVAGLMDAIQIPKAHVLGVSMGGAVAQELALSHPEKVHGLILCGTFCSTQSFLDSTDEGFRDFLVSCANGQVPEMSVEDFSETLRWRFTPGYLKENKERLLKTQDYVKYPTPPVGFIRQSQAVLEFDLCERLSGIEVPTLVLGGQEDILVLPENFHFLAETVLKASLKIFEDSWHGFLVEVEDQVIPIILDFLSGIKTK
jgi:pimeloyl-ACP methyl ester carboxylesterase